MNIEKKLLDYLKDKVKNGQNFFKAKHIAQDIGETPKCVGQTLLRLSKQKVLFRLSVKEKVDILDISQWSHSSSATWRVIRVPRSNHAGS